MSVATEPRPPLGAAGAPRTLRCTTFGEAEPWLAAWDALAVRRSMPLATPAAARAFWEALPPGAVLRLLLVVDADELLGVAALYARPHRIGGATDHRLLGAGIGSRIGPLVREGAEHAVGRGIAEGLTATTPPVALVGFEATGAPDAGPVVEAARRAWPGRIPPGLREDLEMTAPLVTLEGLTAEAWMAAKSKNFRHKEKQASRAAVRAGAVARRCASEADLATDLAAFARLHAARWEERGGSTTLTPDSLRALGSLARHLLPQGRLWLYVLEIEGQAIGAYYAVAAGEEVLGIALGFDDAHAAMRPGHQLMHAIIRDACAAGVARFDLGSGTQSYKVRFADAERALGWQVLFPRDRHAPLARLRSAPSRSREHLRHLAHRLPPERREALLRLRARLRQRTPEPRSAGRRPA